jgi:Acyclic terpene utilisation family protein AtuA
LKSIRIGAGQGFWGDTPFPALEVVQSGQVRYLGCDALAELTLAILQKGRQKNPDKGYVEDMFFRVLLQPCWAKGVKILTNAGGINPVGAGQMVFDLAKAMGLRGMRIAVITGDDIMDIIDVLKEKDVDLRDMETGGDIWTIRDRILFANAYLGAKPMVEALRQGADVIITGRTSDPALFLAPLVYEFGWGWDDWDRLAAGILVGHLLECSAQSTGGNFSGDWWNLPEMERIGYPVAEVSKNGDFVLTKPDGTGGRVNLETVKEQMLYEVHDPSTYVTPDVVADFCSPRLEAAGRDRVRITGMRGKPRPENLKVSIGYRDGWMCDATIRYSWPQALRKARKADEIIRRQFEVLGMCFEEVLTEYVGYNSLCGPLAFGDGEDLNEVGLRIAVRSPERSEAARMPRVFPPLALNGPPTASGWAGTPNPRELIGLWSALVPREEVESRVKIAITEVN